MCYNTQFMKSIFLILWISLFSFFSMWASEIPVFQNQNITKYSIKDIRFDIKKDYIFEKDCVSHCCNSCQMSWSNDLNVLKFILYLMKWDINKAVDIRNIDQNMNIDNYALFPYQRLPYYWSWYNSYRYSYAIPYKKWIITFKTLNDLDNHHKLAYITYNKWILYQFLMDDTFIHDLNPDKDFWLTTKQLKNVFFFSKKCNDKQSCNPFEDYFTNKIQSKEMDEWLNAFKKKIDKLFQ